MYKDLRGAPSHISYLYLPFILRSIKVFQQSIFFFYGISTIYIFFKVELYIIQQ